MLTQIRSEIDTRLREVRPLLAEYERLLIAADALAAGKDARHPSPSCSTKALAPVTEAPVSVTKAPSTPVSAAVPVRPAPRAPRAQKGVSAAAPKRAQRGAAAVAIVAALEHGSHTVAELTIVTAMSGAIIQSNLRRLQQVGTVTRTRRPGDGKAAYALTVAPV